MLTAKQEAFVQNIIQGMSQADAYRKAYPNQKMSDKTIWESASKLMANHKVSARLLELRNELAKPSIMSAQERLEWLTGLIKSEEESTTDKLRAADIMNKMQGEYSVTKVKSDGFTSKYDTTIHLKEGDILVFEEEGRGYIKPVEEFVTIAEAIDELTNIKDLG